MVRELGKALADDLRDRHLAADPRLIGKFAKWYLISLKDMLLSRFHAIYSAV